MFSHRIFYRIALRLWLVRNRILGQFIRKIFNPRVFDRLAFDNLVKKAFDLGYKIFLNLNIFSTYSKIHSYILYEFFI